MQATDDAHTRVGLSTCAPVPVWARCAMMSGLRAREGWRVYGITMIVCMVVTFRPAQMNKGLGHRLFEENNIFVI